MPSVVILTGQLLFPHLQYFVPFSMSLFKVNVCSIPNECFSAFLSFDKFHRSRSLNDTASLFIVLTLLSIAVKHS